MRAGLEVFFFCWGCCLLVTIILGVREMVSLVMERCRLRRCRRWHRRPHTCEPGFAGPMAKTPEEMDALYEASR